MVIKTSDKIPTIAIVGRPNVGKSALFNAILKKRISIVHEQSGVTRDSVMAPFRWNNGYYQIIDTGGLGEGVTTPSRHADFFDTKIGEQVTVALDSADILLLVTDITSGVTPIDMEVANTLRKSGKKIIVVVNKADNIELERNLSEYYSLGIDDVVPVSCLHRRGIGELIDFFTEKLEGKKDYQEEERIKITVTGRPNVGKSSIINRLIGENKLIVSDIAGTTRDSVDMPLDIPADNEIIKASLIDTAGLRKSGRADSAIEIFSIMRAKDAIKKADIVLLTIEAAESGPTAQDAHIGRLISDAGKGCIIVANKWDKCSGLKQRLITEEIRRVMPFLAYAPIVFTCALSGYNFKNLLSEMKEVNDQFKIKIPTSALNKVLNDAVTSNHPPCMKGRFFKIFYATMVSNKPPMFAIFVNDPKLCKNNYEMYLKNYLRKAFDLHGLPILLKFKKRVSKDK